MSTLTVIASEAKQSSLRETPDCFVASLLATTETHLINPAARNARVVAYIPGKIRGRRECRVFQPHPWPRMQK
jgi:hypothetical protein